MKPSLQSGILVRFTLLCEQLCLVTKGLEITSLNPLTQFQLYQACSHFSCRGFAIGTKCFFGPDPQLVHANLTPTDVTKSSNIYTI